MKMSEEYYDDSLLIKAEQNLEQSKKFSKKIKYPSLIFVGAILLNSIVYLRAVQTKYVLLQHAEFVSLMFAALFLAHCLYQEKKFTHSIMTKEAEKIVEIAKEYKKQKESRYT